MSFLTSRSDEWPQPDELLEPPEVAAYLKVPVTTLYAWRHRDVGPEAIRVGKHLRYRRSTVEAWLEGQQSGNRPGGYLDA